MAIRVAIFDGRNFKTTLVYDAAIAGRNDFADASSTHTVYDAAGRATQTTDGRGNPRFFTMIRAATVQTIRPDGGSSRCCARWLGRIHSLLRS